MADLRLGAGVPLDEATRDERPRDERPRERRTGTPIDDLEVPTWAEKKP
jgi:hypothetical protein